MNLSTLQALAQEYQCSCTDHFLLKKHRVIGKHEKYKILGIGLLSLKLSVAAHRCSAAALQAIQDVGGAVTILSIYE